MFEVVGAIEKKINEWIVPGFDSLARRKEFIQSVLIFNKKISHSNPENVRKYESANTGNWL